MANAKPPMAMARWPTAQVHYNMATATIHFGDNSNQGPNKIAHNMQLTFMRPRRAANPNKTSAFGGFRNPFRTRHTWPQQSRWHARTKCHGTVLGTQNTPAQKVTIHIKSIANYTSLNETTVIRCDSSKQTFQTAAEAVSGGLLGHVRCRGQGSTVAMFGCSRSRCPICPPSRTRLETESKSTICPYRRVSG